MGEPSIVNSFFWKMLERFTAQALNLIIQIVLARILLPEQFGSIAIISAIINYAAIFVQSGLATAIIQRKEITKDHSSTLLTTSLVIASLLYLLLFFIAPRISSFYEMPDLIWAIRVMALSLFLGAFNSVQTALFTREMRFKAIFFRSILAVPISGAVGIILALNGGGIWALVAQNLVNTIVIVIYMSFDRRAKVSFGFSLPAAKSLYSFTWKILASGLICNLSDTLRTMIIGKVYTKDNLAYYDKAYTYSGLLTQTIDTSIMGVLLPSFSKLHESPELLLSKARKSVQMTCFIMFPILLGACALAKPLIVLLLTEKWATCIPFFMLFCIFRLPVSIVMIDKQIFLAKGNSTIGLLFEVFLLIANVIMLLITVSISIKAIAYGAIIVQYLADFGIFLISSRFYQYSIIDRMKDMFMPFLSSVTMAGLMSMVLRLNLSNLHTIVIQLVIGSLTYIFISKLLKDASYYSICDIIRTKLKNNKKH